MENFDSFDCAVCGRKAACANAYGYACSTPHLLVRDSAPAVIDGKCVRIWGETPKPTQHKDYATTPTEKPMYETISETPKRNLMAEAFLASLEADSEDRKTLLQACRNALESGDVVDIHNTLTEAIVAAEGQP